MGKTAQTIAVIAAVLGGGAAATLVLVVAPATVVPVWLAEFRKFLGTEAPAIVTADGDSAVRRGGPAAAGDGVGAASSRSSARGHGAARERLHGHARPHRFDEAHRLKNPGTKQSTVASSL
ncbi:hypothetical protein JL720_8518 [Aureococcus anophagefferens]|nr:hypothetical protein JL720_8518 [Aureococcus anophagefferens]